ncbi:28S ribosomal protein S22, mitochondrial [Aphelenchoides fujianensis]|nr:28S ribosomal protein S22, mitochondrial [Aphelenchoides fujianensis]
MSSRRPLVCFRRGFNSWIADNARRSATPKNFDVEQTFINRDVQNLLYKLTGLDLHGKVFRERNINKQERSHYALMTGEHAVKKMEGRGRKFLQKPRKAEFSVLAKDREIAGFDESKFVFTDITFDATNRNRLVVIREPDGTLRTALPEEHDRMNRVYYEQPDRPVQAPNVFSEPYLQEALKAGKHEFVLDWACYFYEPDDQESRARCSTRIVQSGRFELLHSTRHFGPLVFYLILNGQHAAASPLLCALRKARFLPPPLNDVADVLRLQQLVFPDWRTASAAGESDEKVVENFLKQNRWINDKVPQLLKLLKGEEAEVEKPEGERRKRTTNRSPTRMLNKKRATTSRENLHSAAGPLGREAADYPVRLTRKDDGRPDGKSERPPRERRGRPNARRSDKRDKN